MYCKFSIVQFTTLSYVQQQQQQQQHNSVSFDIDISSYATSQQSNKPRVEVMPKKRGRPTKNEPTSNTHMIITSTENIPNNETVGVQKKRKNPDSKWKRNVIPNTSDTVSSSISQMSSAMNHTEHKQVSSTCVRRTETTTTTPENKKKIIRSSISIKELLN